MIDVDSEIAKTVAKRAYRLDFETVYNLLDQGPFLLAGGALCGDEVRDFDLYPDSDAPFTINEVAKSVQVFPGDAEVLFESKNALTVRLVKKNQVVQFCSYRKPSLEDLVKSFDFSHIQVGIRFRGNGCAPFHEHVFYTDKFVVANVARRTEYTGTEYPLSSLMRLFKYYKRGKLNKSETMQTAMRIVKDVVVRGFENYDDYKNQLDAIDLAYTDSDDAFELYKSMARRGLVKHVSPDVEKGRQR